MNVEYRAKFSWRKLLGFFVKPKLAYRFLRNEYIRAMKRYYFEDFIRVYPDGIEFDRRGRKRKTSPNDVRNFLNHQKFYSFCTQFVEGRKVADVGCGSGHGCETLKRAGASGVWGADLSRHSIRFAKSRYGEFADFSIQGITHLSRYSDDFFDVSVCCEVLEHVKEYGVEKKAVREIKRITRKNGLVILGTPNSEMHADHGFDFEEINVLISRNFREFRIFENALVPIEEGRARWEDRLSQGRTGVVVSQRINFDETVMPEGATPEVKQGSEPSVLRIGDYEIDTSLLHNTHSWIVVAVNDK